MVESGLRYRWDAIGVAVAFFLLVFGGTIMGYYTLGLTLVLNSYEFWAFIGVVVFSLVIGSAGLYHWLMDITPKLMSSGMAWTISEYVEIKAGSLQQELNPALIRQYETQLHIELPKTGSPFGDAEGKPVPDILVPLGGLKGMGLFERPGGDGLLWTHPGMLVPMGDVAQGAWVFCPFIIIPLDHNQVPPHLLEVAQQIPKFKPGQTQFYMTTSEIDPQVASWLVAMRKLVLPIVQDAPKTPVSPHGVPDGVWLLRQWLGTLGKSANLEEEVRQLRAERRAWGQRDVAVAQRSAAYAGGSSRLPASYGGPNEAITDLRDRGGGP